MHIREYQQWLEAWDKARHFDRVLPSHTLIHALEELGEISKLVQYIEGYRPSDGVDLEQVRNDLALEFSDLQVMVFKLAYLCGIDMEDAMQRGQQKADKRSPDPTAGPQIRQAYWQRIRQYIADHQLDDEQTQLYSNQ